jgi:Flp pilus assembly pilin Flp
VAGAAYQLFFSGAREASHARLEPFDYGRDSWSSKSARQGGQIEMLATVVHVQVLAAALAARGRRLVAGERGQGTVEYVALVTLVAIVMVGVIAALKTAKFTEGQELGSLILEKIGEAVSKVKY